MFTDSLLSLLQVSWTLAMPHMGEIPHMPLPTQGGRAEWATSPHTTHLLPPHTGAVHLGRRPTALLGLATCHTPTPGYSAVGTLFTQATSLPCWRWASFLSHLVPEAGRRASYCGWGVKDLSYSTPLHDLSQMHYILSVSHTHSTHYCLTHCIGGPHRPMILHHLNLSLHLLPL